jgi:hypothetical protein
VSGLYSARSSRITGATAGEYVLAVRDPVGGANIEAFGFAWRTVAGFTAAQQFSISARHLTSYSVFHGGGRLLTPVDLSLGGLDTNLEVRVPWNVDDSVTVGALTGGTATLGPRVGGDAFSELAAAATVQRGILDWELPLVKPMRLRQFEGLGLVLDQTMGAGGTGRLYAWVRFSRPVVQ